MTSWWLQVVEPGHPPRVVTVDETMDVGRAGDDLLLDDPTVSRHHLTVGPADGGLLITDSGSANGTRVDGERITEPVVVGPGSSIHLGETELTVVEGRETTGGAPATSEPADPANRASEAVRDLSKKAAKGGLGTYRRRS